jgi:hypothetical protein
VLASQRDIILVAEAAIRSRPQHCACRCVQTGRKHCHNAVIVHEACADKLKYAAKGRKNAGKDTKTDEETMKDQEQ